MSRHDVYHQWLGIPPEEQPPSFYRLLGVAEFEQDPEVIRNAAERQALHVRRLARGEFTDVGQELLNEVAEAKLWLISPDKRAEYDKSLRAADENRETVEDITPSSVEATYIEIESTPNKDRWIVGYHADCDFRIDWKTVSGIHCQLTLRGGRLYVSDLNSTNGTFINRRRIRDRVAVQSTDLLTLGRDHRVILPRDLLTGHEDGKYVLLVGRGKGNELQIDSPKVSLFHAKLIVDGDSVTVEDLGSKSGTEWFRQGRPAERLKRRRMDGQDIVRFGGVEFRGAELIKFACNHRQEGV